MALFRALESVAPAERRLFVDPLALEFLSPSLRLLVQAARFHPFGALLAWYLDRRWPGARSSGTARTRFIDDACLAALRVGIEQVAILGAGFDARAFRLEDMAHLRVFEVDRPDTLAEKQRVLRRAFDMPPRHVAFVPTDFGDGRLAEALRGRGFDAARRTLFIWEGVTNYLSAEAVDAVFRFIRAAAPGSRVIFTYVHRDVLDHPAAFAGTRSLARTLRDAGEPWTFGFDPAELPGYLRQRGLALLADAGSAEYRARYLGPAARNLHGYAFYRIAVAEVAPPLNHDAAPAACSAQAAGAGYR
jgi:methyltransferase (TIGR00027 family)